MKTQDNSHLQKLNIRRTNGGRVNLLKYNIFGMLTGFASYHRLMIEVFTRKNFGERYFNLASALTVAIFLAMLPVAFTYIQYGIHINTMRVYGGLGGMVEPQEFKVKWWAYISWYAFIALFLKYSWKHKKAQRPTKSLFDFTKYSQYDGDIHPIFREQKFSFIETNTKNIECYFEPAPFFICGFFLALIGQYFGWFLMLSSIVYCVSYIAAYEASKHDLLSQIDQIILNEDMEKVFVKGMAGRVKYRGIVPDSEDERRQLLPFVANVTPVLAVS
ncbi:hypothetical protein [Flavobacterium sp. 3HN19-14]|uniref:hypothetical protein n=1 Tax=Flavobacterium sp. 3HN19-14 TaxID=3448133 RepID=UPI003EDF534C